MSKELDPQITVVVGLQRGDEGKGRVVDMLAQRADIVARGQGGPNAGHTVVTDDGIELALHGVPSGIAYSDKVNLIGRGCLIDPNKLGSEIDDIRLKGFPVSPDNLLLSRGAHLILPNHISGDELREAGPGGQGSTKSGIAQAAEAKYGRHPEAFRVESILDNPDGIYDAIVRGLFDHLCERRLKGLRYMSPEEYAQQYLKSALKLGQYVTDTEVYLHERLQRGEKVLAEGAQAFLLDTGHGMWPYVTSTPTTTNGLMDGLGIPGTKYPTKVIGVIKLIQSHVGGGPFVTEVHDPYMQEQLHGQSGLVDSEEGTTTGRKRRLGALDLPSIRRAILVDGVDELAVTKLDWVPRFGDDIPVCVSYTLDGKEIFTAPDSAKLLSKCIPNYAYLPGWDTNLGGVRRHQDLPGNTRKYIDFIEDALGVPITMIGVGPARHQVIDRR